MSTRDQTGSTVLPVVPPGADRGARASNVGKWKPLYDGLQDTYFYGDTTTYRIASLLLEDMQAVEDWGCGGGGFRRFCKVPYIGVDGTANKFVDKVVDLCSYTTDVDGLVMRGVLEHNYDWERILANAVCSFRRKFCLILFTPFAEQTEEIGYTDLIGVPDLSFRKQDLTAHFDGLRWDLIEDIRTDTQYGVEHIYYVRR